MVQWQTAFVVLFFKLRLSFDWEVAPYFGFMGVIFLRDVFVWEDFM